MTYFYTDNEDGEIECPSCDNTFPIATWEMVEGSQTECDHCGVMLEIDCVDYSRSLTWTVRDDLHWYRFCQMWGRIGSAMHFERHRAESLAARSAPR